MMDLASVRWRKSSRSGGGQHCVEVATDLPGVVAVRDSKRPETGAHVVTSSHWRAFIREVQDGRFDLG